MNIIILGGRIIEDSDNRGSDNRGCTVYIFICVFIYLFIYLATYLYIYYLGM